MGSFTGGQSWKMLLVSSKPFAFPTVFSIIVPLPTELSALALMISSDEVLIPMSFVCHLYVLLFVRFSFRAFP